MLSGVSRKDVLNALAGVMAGYAWVSFACFFILVLRWAAIAPHQPDPAHGLIFPHNEHGSITYFSAFQSTSCTLLLNTSPFLFMLAAVIVPKKKAVYKSSRLGFSMKWKPDDPRKIGQVSTAIGSVLALLVVFVLGPPIVTYLNSIGFAKAF